MMLDPLQPAFGTALKQLLPLVLLYILVATSPPDSPTLRLVNGFAPFYFIAVMMLLVYRVIRSCPDAIWTPAMWFPFSSAVFFGAGPLVESYGNEATRAALRLSPLAITPEQLLNANMLSMVGVLSVVLGFWLHARLNPKTWLNAIRKTSTLSPTLRPETVALGFVIAGGVLNHALINPAHWGMIDLVLPGFLTNIAPITDVGFAIMAFLAVRGNRWMLLLFLILWPAHLFLCFLSFAKKAVVFALLLPAIGAFIGHRRIWLLGVYLIAAALVYMAFQPLVLSARVEIRDATGSIAKADYGRRYEILRSYISDRPQDEIVAIEDQQDWWIRLNYAGVQAFAMHLYDQGYAANTIRDVWLYFIPRVIWPEKPILITPGHELTDLIYGDPELSNTGLSIYGDAYWQFGWPGVVVSCLLVGLLFGMMTVQSLCIISARDFILLPIVLIGMKTAVQTPTEFLISIIGVLPIYFAYLFGVRFIAKLFRSSGAR